MFIIFGGAVKLKIILREAKIAILYHLRKTTKIDEHSMCFRHVESSIGIYYKRIFK